MPSLYINECLQSIFFCFQTCRPKTAGSVCRGADHECDLPEFCTGQSEFCPEDVFKMDGEKCDRGKVSTRVVNSTYLWVLEITAFSLLHVYRKGI